jgi:hypothetical protein
MSCSSSTGGYLPLASIILVAFTLWLLITVAFPAYIRGWQALVTVPGRALERARLGETGHPRDAKVVCNLPCATHRTEFEGSGATEYETGPPPTR